METIFLPVKDICLICLLESNTKLQPISGANAEDLTLTIEECAGIKIPKEAYYPDKICSKCYAYLKVAYKFRVTCRRSLEELQRRVKQEIKLEEHHSFENMILINDESQGFAEHPEDNGDKNHLDEAEEDIFEFAHETLQIEVEPIKSTTKRKYRKQAKESILNNDSEKTQQPKKRGRKRKSKPLEVLETNFKVVDQFSEELHVRSTSRKPKTKDLLICHECGNKYDNKQRLHAHLKQHKSLMERENECEICGKRFITARHLQIHMNTHTGNRPYKCKYCPSAFGDPSSRIKHEHAHDNIRAYKCDICDKTFTYSYALTKHQRIHTGEKPYGCTYCQKRFIQKHHQKAHELTHAKQFARELKQAA